MYDLRTTCQKERAAHRERAVRIFNRIKEHSVEGTTDNRVMVGVAEEMGCTRQNVRMLLVRAGVITPKRRPGKKS